MANLFREPRIDYDFRYYFIRSSSVNWIVRKDLV